MMKNILLSSALVVFLGLSGCGNDTTKTVSSSKALDAVKSLTRPADASYVLSWSKDDSVELFIANSADSSKFEIENSATRSILKFKNDVTPTYIEGGKNEYVVEVDAKDISKNLIKKIGTYRVKVPRPPVMADTTAPTITSEAIYHFTDATSSITLTATDDVTLSNEIQFAIPAGESMFTLSGALLTPAFNSGEHSVLVTATDKAGNQGTKNITVDVNVSGVQTFEISNVENNATNWSDANTACSTMGAGWRLPTIGELQENNVTIFNTKIGNIDSDFDASNGTNFTSVLWSSTPVDGNTSQVQGLWYRDGNLSKVQELDRDKAGSYFHLCVKP